VFAKLKKQSDYYNFRQRTIGDFFADVRQQGWRATIAERAAWGRMRMSDRDLADVSGATYTYLLNGQPPAANWTGLFQPGERVRLRLINGSAMTYFDVRIPGVRLTVVAADGLPVQPVAVDELRIAVAETYDVIVEPAGAEAFTVFAQAMDRTGFAAGTLAVREGLRAELPALDPRPALTMADMGHGAMEHGAAPAAAADPHAGHGAVPGAAAAHGDGAVPVTHPVTEQGNPLVDMRVSMPVSKLDDPGIGLRDNGRRVLTYADLVSSPVDPAPASAQPAGHVHAPASNAGGAMSPDSSGAPYDLQRDADRTIELHLTGHMQRFVWSFDGVRFSSADPIHLVHGERVRIVLVNDTMMSHPIHLHGMWSDLEDDTGRPFVRKHTIDVPPGSRRSFRVTAEPPGRWAFHCHLLFHMEAGMFREVRVEERAG
jgi:FtsP/CotA-like multicopper oxidase with cupredoxin domain